MSISTVFAIVGAFAGTAGSIITAFGANRTLSALHLAQAAHDLTIRQLATNPSPVPIFDGLDRQFERAESHGAKLVRLGVLLLAAGFILQSLSVLCSSH